MFRKTLNPTPAPSRAIFGTIPAHHFQLLTQKVRKVAIKNRSLTHDLTHQPAHTFGSPVSLEMSVHTGVAAKFQFEVSFRFLPVFRAAKKLRQMPPCILTQITDTACSLSYSLTFKTVIL